MSRSLPLQHRDLDEKQNTILMNLYYVADRTDSQLRRFVCFGFVAADLGHLDWIPKMNFLSTAFEIVLTIITQQNCCLRMCDMKFRSNSICKQATWHARMPTYTNDSWTHTTIQPGLLQSIAEDAILEDRQQQE